MNASRAIYFPLGNEITRDYAPDYERIPAATVKDAQLVSSRTSDELHAPALDIDLLAEVVKEGSTYTLWVDVRASRRKYKKLISSLCRYNLASPTDTRWRSLSKKKRLQSYAAVQESVVDAAEFEETMVALGPAAESSFLDLVGKVELLSSFSAKRGKDLLNPWPISFTSKTFLLSSTHNSHLYVEKEIPWEDYKKVLKSLAKAKVIEKNYLNVSLERKATHLRLPWIKKA